MQTTTKYGSRQIAQGVFVTNDTLKTQLNNNDLIIGPSGAGKTGGYVAPLILGADSSMIITDTKGNLAEKYRKHLEQKGFKVYVLDFVNPETSTGYNPLEYIGKTKNGKYREMDIKTISNILIQDGYTGDQFWIQAARSVLETIIAFVLENLPEEEHNLASVAEVYRLMKFKMPIYGDDGGIDLFNEIALNEPDSITARRYASFKNVILSEKTWGSITQFVTNALSNFDIEEYMNMLTASEKFRFESIGREPTAVFVNTSDSDRSMDGLISIFYSQCFQSLIKEADKKPNNRLNVPVRLVLDDFAASTLILDFENLISIIRSRDIYVSIILQSLTQLDSRYGYTNARTIINNCDHIIYLGGSDRETCDYIADRSGTTPDKIMHMPLDKEFLIERGKRGELVDKVKPYSQEPDTMDAPQ